jgi:hypothetical protein
VVVEKSGRVLRLGSIPEFVGESADSIAALRGDIFMHHRPNNNQKGYRLDRGVRRILRYGRTAALRLLVQHCDEDDDDDDYFLSIS